MHYRSVVWSRIKSLQIYDIVGVPYNPIEINTYDLEWMMNPKFEIFKGKDDHFFFHLKAGNGEVGRQNVSRWDQVRQRGAVQFEGVRDAVEV